MAVDFFLARFKSKTIIELKTIIEGDDYTPAAKEAAQIILKERAALGPLDETVDEVKSPSALPPPIPSIPETKMGIHPFNPMAYLRSWGKKDLMTHLCIGILWLAIYEFMLYYSNEPAIYPVVRNIGITLFGLTIILNSALYRRDHGKSNNYFGRCLSDSAFSLVFLILTLIYHSLIRDIPNPLVGDPGDFLGLPLGLFILFMMVESIVSLFKYLFGFLKWQIL